MADVAERYSGVWHDKSVSFKREFRGKRLTDEECDKLCEGDEIEITGLVAKSGATYGVVARLADLEYNGHEYVGIEQVRFIERDSSSAPSAPKGKPLCKCPRCGKNIYENNSAFSCEDRDCGCVIFKKDHFFERQGKKMTASLAKELFTKGYADVKGLVSPKTGSTYDARVDVDFPDKFPKYSLKFFKKDDD